MAFLKIFSIFIFSFVLLNQVQGWVAMGKYYNEANPGKCTISDELIVEPGQTVKSPNDCSKITCNSGDGMASVVGCGAIAPPENCLWGDYVDVYAEFPACCERHAICSNEKTLAYVNNIKNILTNSKTKQL